MMFSLRRHFLFVRYSLVRTDVLEVRKCAVMGKIATDDLR